jgi:SecD/SecF fusion protein
MKDQNLKFRAIFLMLLTALAVWTLVPSVQLHSQPADQKDAYLKANPTVSNKAVKFGLDLAGGTSVVVELDTTELKSDEIPDALQTSLAILRNRVDQFGLSEPVIAVSGRNRISAELAGMDQDGAKQLIGKTAKLEFKLVQDPDRVTPTLNRIHQMVEAKRGGNAAAAPAAVLPGAPKEAPKLDADALAAQLAGTTAPAASPDTTKKAETAQLGDSSKVAQADSSATPAVAAPVVEEKPIDLAGHIDLAKLPRPFMGSENSYLLMYGQEVAVRSEDMDTVRMLLGHPEIRKLVPGDQQLALGGIDEVSPTNQKLRILYGLKKRSEMGGQDIENATAMRMTTGTDAGQVGVSLKFNSKGAKDFARVTGNNVRKRLAIVLDSQVISAPNILDRISGGNAQITGLADFEEAKQLSVVLKAGALPAAMKIAELRTVGASLGEDNVRVSLVTGIGAVLITLVFMLLYYRRPGVNSGICLLLNMLLIGGVLAMFGATLSLPGIAGLILTIGMAVDGNVLIFERLREELNAGRTPRMAVKNSFEKAFSAILDSNITTFATAFILYQLGSGPIKGFGLTMMIGIATTMFATLFVSRTLFMWQLSSNDKTMTVGDGIKWVNNTRLDVIRLARPLSLVSAAVMVIFVGLWAVVGFTKSIDFTGGQVISFDTQKEISLDEVRSIIESKTTIQNPSIKTIGDDYQIRLAMGSKDIDQAVTQIKTALADYQVEILSEDIVGASISEDLTRAAWWAIIWSLIVIMIYVWVRFGTYGLGFGVGAVVTLAHDVLFVSGIFIILKLEIDGTFIAAILTILGYSLNDSIVIYDRIRENTQILGKSTYSEAVNRSVNETFSRTVITGGTTFLSVVLLAVFGDGSISNFAIAMAIGIAVGTYSSIFISAPFVNWWVQRRTVKPKKG